MATKIIGQGIATPIPYQHEGVEVEKTTSHDYFRGTAPALIAAGILELRHLEQPSGCRRGTATAFMPDGSPVPEGITVGCLAGAFSVRVLGDGRREVRRAIAADECERRKEAETTCDSRGEHYVSYSGSRERLVRDGVPDRWLSEVVAPGKKRGRHVFYEDERKIQVSGSENGYRVQVTHIDYYKGWRRDIWLRMRAEYGLPLIVRGHLSLVWSRPEEKGAPHGRV